MQDIPYPPATHYQYLAPIASIIKFPPQVQAEKYQDLMCTQQDQERIFEIIVTLGENDILTIAANRGHIQHLGSQVIHVHPFKFLTTIFSNPRLKGCMPAIFSRYFTRQGFMDGLAPSFEREVIKGKVELFINDFAAELSLSADAVRPYIQHK